MDQEPLIKIRRDGQELGSWDRFQIRQYIASGAILPSDEQFDPEKEKWLPLLPPYRRKWALFDWIDEGDAQFYYVRDGLIHGPRLIGEILCLCNAGFLTRETLVAYVGSDEWATLNHLLEEPAAESPESLKDQANAAINAFREGDNIGAGLSGLKALGTLFKGVREVFKPIPADSPWVCTMLDYETIPTPQEVLDLIRTAGFQITEHKILDGRTQHVLVMKFVDAAEAIRAVEALNLTKIGDKELRLYRQSPPEE